MPLMGKLLLLTFFKNPVIYYEKGSDLHYKTFFIKYYYNPVGGVFYPIELQIKNKSVSRQMCWYDGRKIFRWTPRTENLHSVWDSNQGQI